jgi:hypothetical protein
MLSIMQLRLREEYDIEHEQIKVGLFETNEDNVYSYGNFEEMCLVEVKIIEEM